MYKFVEKTTLFDAVIFGLKEGDKFEMNGCIYQYLGKFNHNYHNGEIGLSDCIISVYDCTSDKYLSIDIDGADGQKLVILN